MFSANRPSREKYYYPTGLVRLKYFLKMVWVNFLWHKRNPYGYCEGFNWATCISIPNTNCPYVKYGIHCSHNFSLYDSRFDSKEAWEEYDKFREDAHTSSCEEEVPMKVEDCSKVAEENSLEEDSTSEIEDDKKKPNLAELEYIVKPNYQYTLSSNLIHRVEALLKEISVQPDSIVAVADGAIDFVYGDSNDKLVIKITEDLVSVHQDLHDIQEKNINYYVNNFKC